MSYLPSSYLFDPENDTGFQGWASATRQYGIVWPFYMRADLTNAQGDTVLYSLLTSPDTHFAPETTQVPNGAAQGMPTAYKVDVDPDTLFGGLLGYTSVATVAYAPGPVPASVGPGGTINRNNYFPLRFPEFAIDTYRAQRAGGASVSVSVNAARLASSGQWGYGQSDANAQRVIAAHQENEQLAAHVLDPSDPTGLLAQYYATVGVNPPRALLARAAGLSNADAAALGAAQYAGLSIKSKFLPLAHPAANVAKKVLGAPPPLAPAVIRSSPTPIA